MSSLDSSISDGFINIPDVPVDATTDRVQPRQVATGITRGTQTVMNTDGSYMTLGLIPNTTDFGIAFFDNSNTLISKTTASTQYLYDKTTGKNIMQIGKLPDGTYGMIVANTGYNVSELFT